MEVSICLNFTGTTDLGPTMNAYSDVDNYSSPIGGTILVSNLVPNNCPYILTGVPDGTTKIRLVSTTSPFCCVNLIVGAFNICEVCDNLGFSDATNPNIGQLSLGFLTGSCDTNISNFYLEWYGPGTGSTQLQFTSGLGTSYITPNIQHPLTGTTSPYLYPGQYRPVIKEIEIDNVVYSNTYGAYGDCFQNSPFVVLPYTISNGSAAPEPYQHCLELNNNATQPSTGLIELSGGTNYVPFRLDGGIQADLLRIYFSGASYLTPIPIESIVIGNSAGSTILGTEFDMTLSNLNYKTFGDAGTFTKVLCLTGLTRNPGDVLLFEITPQGTTPTDFTFCFTQLNTFDCEMCALTSDYHRIVESSLSAITGNCGGTQITFNVSGCSSSVDVNEDLYKYIFSGSGSASLENPYGSVGKTVNLTTTGPIGCGIQDFNYLGTITPDCVVADFSVGSSASEPYVNTYDAGTGTRTIKIYGKSQNWYDYQNYLLDSFNSTISAANSSGIYDNNPNNYGYWSILTLWLPRFDLNFISNFLFLNSCWDFNDPDITNFGSKRYNPITRTNDVPFHFAANTVNAAITIEGPYQVLTITGKNFIADPALTIIPNEYPSGPCVARTCWGGDGSFYAQINTVSTSLLNTTYNINVPSSVFFNSTVNFNKFAYNKNPWSYRSIYETFTAPLTSASTYNKISMYQYENKTFPLTGTPGSYGVLIADTATTCPNITNYTFDENSGTTTLNNYVRYNYLYTVTYIDNLDNTKYQILATPISSNGQPITTSPPILIGTGTSNPSTFDVIDGAYFI